jgi:hypothetical protein
LSNRHRKTKIRLDHLRILVDALRMAHGAHEDRAPVRGMEQEREGNALVLSQAHGEDGPLRAHHELEEGAAVLAGELREQVEHYPDLEGPLRIDLPGHGPMRVDGCT